MDPEVKAARQSYERAFHRSVGAVVLSGIVIGLFTLLEHSSAIKVQEVERRASERDLERIKKESDRKIEEAKRDAGLANENAGLANERAASLEKENIERRAQVAGLEKEAADAKLQLHKLEDATARRHVTPEQEKVLIDAFSKVRGASAVFSHAGDDSEAGWFAGELSRVATAAGWISTTLMIMGHTSARGVCVQVGVKEISELPEAARVLIAGLTAIGLSPKLEFKEALAPTSVEVLIAGK